MSRDGPREVLNLRRQRPQGQGRGAAPVGAPGAGTSGVTPVSPQGPPEKRTRRESADGDRSADKQPIDVEDEPEGRREEQSAEGVEGTWVHPWELPWTPEFRHYSSRLITHADTIKNLGVAYGMLQGCILPRDAQAVDGVTEDLTGEIAQALFTGPRGRERRAEEGAGRERRRPEAGAGDLRALSVGLLKV
ncbi:hypothetical protein RHMOL_Rhmol06G0002900 [Rhododendron molle]|uniref:Uncharacterized protein n=1 Tax=Rhododendron molle TaxID=49168 RepID=A0ACC0N7T0_RHOML|nr:hypothetical protein RHMOL_Rhmol06G0002900 [Rhododendron molle]